MEKQNSENQPAPENVVENALGKMALEKSKEAHRILKENAEKISPEAIASLKDGLALKIGKALLDYTKPKD